jgi:hypothetical protein
MQSPAHAEAVLPRGGNGQTIDRMAHQAFGQGRNESRVSRQEVASPSGCSLPLGWILPRRVRLTSAVEEMVDAAEEGVLRSETGKGGPFINMTTVWSLSGLVGDPPGASSVSGGHCREAIPREAPHNRRDRGITPIES